ncbi:MAG: fibronectin type III domain-containing protein [Lachnospiraceae bacterium]|nr:fibronectin type III domain-containing protein [Lachnospiraceae bacterium]
MVKNVNKQILSGIMSLTMAVSVLAGVPFTGKINAEDEIVLHNPVVDMDAMCAGQKVTWDCVYFGSYPQTEVKAGDSEYEALQSAEGWDDNGDIVMNDNVINNNVVNGTKYRRILKGDATYATSGSGSYYDWEDSATYHYFRYEPVKWRVLETDGSNAMLLSDIALDDRKYNTEEKDTTWETSTIRSWLNGYNADINQERINYVSSNFIDSAFTPEEQSAIVDTNVINNNNLNYDIEGGNNTTDKLFLLSESEVCTDTASIYGFAQDRENYDEARRCKISDYAKAMGVYSFKSEEGNCVWWLRSPGGYSDSAVSVHDNGYISYDGYDVNSSRYGVRVALNLNLSSSNIYTYAGTVCSDGIMDESGKAEENISNPRIVNVTDAQRGQNAKWDCVYFGIYPQTEVKDTDSEYSALQSAEGWDGNGDAVVNGTKYRRMLKGDATCATSGSSSYYGWEDDTTYHYFKYEPVKWRVLKTDGSNIMLLSDIVLDDRKYNTVWNDTTWETSTIRSWLNGYNGDMNQEGINYSSSNFIDSAFTTKEQSAIADTNVVNNDNLEYGTEGGNDTVDKLFLLSESEIYTKEAKAYGFSKDRFVFDISRRSKSSDYAKAMGVKEGNCYWWLRTPGGYSNSAAYVNNNGYINDYGYSVKNNDNGVRVALNLNLSSSNLYTYAGTVCSDGTVSVIEKPSTEEPTTEEPSTEEQTTEKPSTEEQTTEQSSTEEVTTEQPSTEEQITKEEMTTKEEPTTEEEQVTEQSTPEKSTTEEPTTEKTTVKKKSQTIKVTKSYTKTYGAKAFKLNAKLTKGNGKLKYTTSNKTIAVADKNGKVTIKGTGICTITVTASATDTYKAALAKITITVKPKKNKVTKLKAAGSRTLNVTWKKDTKCTGYELQCSASKKFTKKDTIIKNISKNKTTSYKIRKLAKGKKYYIRIRAYRNVKVNGKTNKLYGDWSAVKQSGKVK